MDVKPYVKDITDELVSGTSTRPILLLTVLHCGVMTLTRNEGPNQISYYATFDGKPPHETGGYVVMSSYLVYWS